MDIKYNKKRLLFIVNDKEINEIEFNFICCNLFRIQEEYRYLLSKSKNYNEKELLENDYEKIHIYSKLTRK